MQGGWVKFRTSHARPPETPECDTGGRFSFQIWKGRENKSTSVSEPVLHLTPGQFCRLLSYIVATTVSQRVSDPCAIGTGSSYLDLFSIYFR